MGARAGLGLSAVLLGLGLDGTRAEAQEIERRVYEARAAEGGPPVIDGLLDDACWRGGPWAGDFVQREPEEGRPATQPTFFRIVYDDDRLYVAIRALDDEPSAVEARVSRRDDRQGDRVAVQLDTYFDHRTAFVFELTAAGVRIDGIISDDGETEDLSWDAVWHGKTAIGPEGWTAEMAIPLDQLRFAPGEGRVWGLEVSRWLHRREELSQWQLVPKDASGFVFWFGELRGLDGLAPRRLVEIVPYTAGRIERAERIAGDPFATGRDAGAALGADGRVGLSSDLTLTWTVHPDFGQVEADPSELNLTTFETFFEERRPFFVEGSQIFNFSISGGDGPFSQDNLFYSRRVGRPPRRRPDAPGASVAVPDETSILGAVKLTGKTRTGWSLGVLEALTAREVATIDDGHRRWTETAEPLASHLVLRVQKDFDRGNTVLGALWTSTRREGTDDDLWHTAADTGGVDLRHNWGDRTHWLSAKAVFSLVRGSPGAIRRTQESPLRYFQRPDAEHLELDPSRTSLAGHGGDLAVGRGGNGRWLWGAGLTWRSPDLELNDVGFLRAADRIMQWTWLGWRRWEPAGIVREARLNANQWRGWDFGGERLFSGGNVNGRVRFRSSWSVGGGLAREGEGLAPNELRGGPGLRLPGGWGTWLNIESDTRRALRFEAGSWRYRGDENAVSRNELWGDVVYRPAPSIELSVSPSLGRLRRELQYVDTVDDGAAPHYLFGRLEQTTFALTVRVGFAPTPDLSIQYYGQPFVSAGDYTELREITAPRAARFAERWVSLAGATRLDRSTGALELDLDGDGLAETRLGDPDFGFRQFRSNLVLRWEPTPGSTLFVVWSQERTGDGGVGDFRLRRDLGGLFRIRPHNVFLVKYRRYVSF